MTYQITGIQKLSPTQVKNLLAGKNVRVKKGSSHYIKLHSNQLQKLEHAHKSNKGITVKLDATQVMHGKGVFTDIYNKVKTSVKSGVKSLARQHGRKLIDLAHSKAVSALEKHTAGSGIKKKRGRPRKTGKGVLSDVLGLISKGTNALGLGIKKRGRPCKSGKGLMTDLAKATGATLLDHGAKALRGSGRRTYKKKTCSGGALFPAGMGVKRRGRPRKIRAGALFPA